MAGNSTPIERAQAIRQRLAQRLPEQQVPGTLTQWADGQRRRYWEFVGNGQTTGTEFVQAVIEREGRHGEQPGSSEQEPDGEGDGAAQGQLGPLAELPFARYAAGRLLEGDPDAAIPAGKVQELALRELLGLVAPFLEEYRRAHGQGGGGLGGWDGHKKVVGSVDPQGLTLPVD